MDFGIAETGIARGSLPGTTTEVLRFGDPFAEIRVVSHPSLLIFSPSPEEKTPRPWTKASNPRRTAPQRNAPFESEFSFSLLLAFVRDFMLYLPFVLF
jgi:hypothetical protein